MKTIHHLPIVPKKRLLTLGKRLIVARKARHWSQADLAERLGLARQTVSRLEKGDPGVSAGYYFSAAWLLGIALLDLDHPDQPISRKKGTPIDDNF